MISMKNALVLENHGWTFPGCLQTDALLNPKYNRMENPQITYLWK